PRRRRIRRRCGQHRIAVLVEIDDGHFDLVADGDIEHDVAPPVRVEVKDDGVDDQREPMMMTPGHHANSRGIVTGVMFGGGPSSGAGAGALRRRMTGKMITSASDGSRGTAASGARLRRS